MAQNDTEKDILTCCNCGAPLLDNYLVKRAYTQNSTVGWAKKNLKILSEMAEDRGLEYFANEMRRIMDGLEYLIDG